MRVIKALNSSFYLPYLLSSGWMLGTQLFTPFSQPCSQIITTLLSKSLHNPHLQYDKHGNRYFDHGSSIVTGAKVLKKLWEITWRKKNIYFYYIVSFLFFWITVLPISPCKKINWLWISLRIYMKDNIVNFKQ